MKTRLHSTRAYLSQPPIGMPSPSPLSLLAFGCLLHAVHTGDISRDDFQGMKDSPTAFRATRSRLASDSAHQRMLLQHTRTQDIKQQHVNNLKQHILNSLGMKKVPKVPVNASATLNPNLLSNFYTNNSQTTLPRKPPIPQEPPLPSHRPVSRPVPALPPTKLTKTPFIEENPKQIIHPEPVLHGPDPHTLEFKLKAPPGANRRVTEAYFRIMVCYKKRDKRRKNPGRKVKIKLFRITEDDTDDSGHEEVISTVISMVRHTKWQRLRLPTTLVQTIMESSTRTLKVKVVCVDCGKDVVLVMTPKGRRHPRSNQRKKVLRRRTGKQPDGKPGGPANRTPYLEIHTANKYRRFRRDVTDEESMDEVTPGCCQLEAFVDFEEFGWHTWILSPKGFNQTFCIGGCGSPPASDSEGTGASPVCCHPVNTSSLPVIYLDTKGEVKGADIPNLVTHSCGCP